MGMRTLKYGQGIELVRNAVKGKRKAETRAIARETGLSTMMIAVTLRREGWTVRNRVWTRR